MVLFSMCDSSARRRLRPGSHPEKGNRLPWGKSCMPEWKSTPTWWLPTLWKGARLDECRYLRNNPTDQARGHSQPKLFTPEIPLPPACSFTCCASTMQLTGSSDAALRRVGTRNRGRPSLALLPPTANPRPCVPIHRRLAAAAACTATVSVVPLLCAARCPSRLQPCSSSQSRPRSCTSSAGLARASAAWSLQPLQFR